MSMQQIYKLFAKSQIKNIKNTKIFLKNTTFEFKAFKQNIN